MQQYADSDHLLIEKLDESIKKCKLLLMYLNDVNDDYGKQKVARLKYEFAKHEYLTLLKEAKNRELDIDKQKNMANMLFH